MNTIFSIYKALLTNTKSNIPALYFLGLGSFGIITIITGVFTDFLIFPFLFVATISAFIAMWYLGILGSLTKQVDKLGTTVERLKNSNDTLHNELLSLQTLRESLEKYAKESNAEFDKVLNDVNRSFERLENITRDNEKVLIARVAQDLEFLDSKAGMKREEYERFVNRIPNSLRDKFNKLGYESFDKVAGDNNIVDYKEIKTIVQSVVV